MGLKLYLCTGRMWVINSTIEVFFFNYTCVEYEFLNKTCIIEYGFWNYTFVESGFWNHAGIRSIWDLKLCVCRITRMWSLKLYPCQPLNMSFEIMRVYNVGFEIISVLRQRWTFRHMESKTYCLLHSSLSNALRQ